MVVAQMVQRWISDWKSLGTIPTAAHPVCDFSRVLLSNQVNAGVPLGLDLTIYFPLPYPVLRLRCINIINKFNSIEDEVYSFPNIALTG